MNFMDDAKEKIQLLKEAIEKRIQSVDSKRLFYRKQSFKMFTASIILSAITTVLLGLKIPELNEFVRLTALVISTVLMIINGYNAFFNYKDLWLANNMARNKLYSLQFSIEFMEKGGAITDDNASSLKNTYQDIIDELNAGWDKSKLGKK
jgi:hypothetical protein